MATTLDATTVRLDQKTRLHPLDVALAAGFCLLAIASLVGVPRALTRIPDGADRLQLLLSSGEIAVLVCIVLVIVWPRIAPRASSVMPRTLPNVTIGLCGLVGVAVMFVAIREFRGWPQFPDTFAEMFQARLLSVGRFWMAAPERQDLLRIGNTVVDEGRWYSQYPIGNPALLAVGIVSKMPWLPGLIVGLLFAAGTMAIANTIGGIVLATITGLLVLASPMVILSSAAVMSNATFAGLAACALALVLRRRATPPQLALAGMLTGLGACVRPLDALILAAALGIYLLTGPAARTSRRVAVPLLIIGTVLGVLPLLFANAQTTGSALRFGYTVLWGDGNMPGFGTRGPGIVFGPVDAVHNLLFDTALLNVSLLAWPVPALVVAAVAVVTRVRSLDARWRLLLGYTLAHILVYFFYWHHDFFFGPRFLLPAAPIVLVILADALRRVVRWSSERIPAQAATFVKLLLPVQAVIAAALVAIPSLTHAASPSIANAAAIARAARSADLGDAFVLVNDGWGSRLFGEMWARGLSASAAEQLYARVDACTLQRALDKTGNRGQDDLVLGELPPGRSTPQSMLSPAEAETAMRTATAGAARGLPLGKGIEPTLRVPAGALPPECAAQLAFDEESYRSPYAPLLWRNDPSFLRASPSDFVVVGSGITFVRDPGPAFITLFATKPVYRVVVASSNGTYVVRFSALKSGAIKEVRFAN